MSHVRHIFYAQNKYIFTCGGIFISASKRHHTLLTVEWPWHMRAASRCLRVK